MNQQDIETLNGLAAELHGLALDKGFHGGAQADFDRWFEGACCNLHSEISELHEAHRSDQLELFCDKEKEMRQAGIYPLSCAEEELADIVIRALDMAGRMKIDIGSAVYHKHAFNKTRPHRHGGRKS